MDRSERLLDLVAFFLDAREPVSLAELREVFPGDYQGAFETAQRKWERDKAELSELGVPLTYVAATDEKDAGYVLDKSAYYLPEPGLTPEELAMLYAAGAAMLNAGAFPGRQDLAHALRKVGFFANGPLPPPAVRVEGGDGPSADVLELLWSAIGARRTVRLDYYSPHKNAHTTRKVDPYGLALRRGTWQLVGYCHLRQALRTFHVRRIKHLVEDRSKTTFDVPDGFSLDRFVASWPWQHQVHEPIEVTVTLSGDLAPLAAQLFPATPMPAQDGVTVTVTATDLDGMAGYVLSLGSDAAVTAPPEAAARQQQLARAALAAHEEAA